jgi:hypothetical protein
VAITTVSRKKLFLSLPFYGEQSHKTEREISNLFEKFYPQLKPLIAFTNTNTIAKYFRTKDILPMELRSNIIYEFQCGFCQEFYIGLTTKTARFRWSQHLGVSHRTLRPLTKIDFSPIRQHSEGKGHRISFQNFKIIDQAPDSERLRVREALHIHLRKPSLNTAVSHSKLSIVG